jgi:hypothetical protein
MYDDGPTGLYDRDGLEITLDQWLHHQEDPDYTIIANSGIFFAGHRVITVWTGIDYQGIHVSHPYPRRTIFETRIYLGQARQIRFPDGAPRLTWSTLSEAKAGHSRAVTWLRARILTDRAARELRPLAGV